MASSDKQEAERLVENHKQFVDKYGEYTLYRFKGLTTTLFRLFWGKQPGREVDFENDWIESLKFSRVDQVLMREYYVRSNESNQTDSARE